MLAAGDYVQASEKFWGAVAMMVKMVAEDRGWRHYSHADLRRAAGNIALESNDADLVVLFGVAERLHANFYEGFMTPEVVESSVAGAKHVISKSVNSERAQAKP